MSSAVRCVYSFALKTDVHRPSHRAGSLDAPMAVLRMPVISMAAFPVAILVLQAGGKKHGCVVSLVAPVTARVSRHGDVDDRKWRAAARADDWGKSSFISCLSDG
ncbi:hypothetical protein ACOMHN_015024 [Nucella lapillus]